MMTKLLLIDDDEAFCAVLARGLGRRGIGVTAAHDPVSALAQARQWRPSQALLDLKLGGEASGLELIEPLLEIVDGLHIVVLTGYASIATTVTAMQRGASGYLAKPVDVAAVAAALGHGESAGETANTTERMSLKRLEWEHIQRVLAEHAGNVSAAARTLGIYRRTLQRKLEKRPVKS